MKQILAYVVLTLILCCALVTAQTRDVSLDGVTNIQDDSLLMAGNTHVFSIRITCANTGDVYNALNGFRIYSPDGATWTTTTLDTVGGYRDNFTQILFNAFGVDGAGADTLGIAAITFVPGVGLQDGWDAVSIEITIGPTFLADNGKHICIDSSFYPPGGVWKWAAQSGGGQFVPEWDGPHCFRVFDPATDVVELDKGGMLPTDFALDQNYPNPFNPTTVIEFDVPVRSHVTLTVYNMLGQEVVTLVDQDRDAGFHQVDWDGRSSSGSSVSSGIYFYKLEADSFVQTKKMMLLK
jgi:hypothetical protein